MDPRKRHQLSKRSKIVSKRSSADAARRKISIPLSMMRALLKAMQVKMIWRVKKIRMNWSHWTKTSLVRENLNRWSLLHRKVKTLRHPHLSQEILAIVFLLPLKSLIIITKKWSLPRPYNCLLKTILWAEKALTNIWAVRSLLVSWETITLLVTANNSP